MINVQHLHNELGTRFRMNVQSLRTLKSEQVIEVIKFWSLRWKKRLIVFCNTFDMDLVFDYGCNELMQLDIWRNFLKKN